LWKKIKNTYERLSNQFGVIGGKKKKLQTNIGFQTYFLVVYTTISYFGHMYFLKRYQGNL